MSPSLSKLATGRGSYKPYKLEVSVYSDLIQIEVYLGKGFQFRSCYLGKIGKDFEVIRVKNRSPKLVEKERSIPPL